ncbi:hypothetical protein IQ268_26760 [Oculatella sp. LEGE 06141]|uniref:hypothetical protein n=1 Tax=Oculatella sp. LEGE 06141 TaxID=1828648 RepID=UPI00187DE8CE|nr:hypothetical protein [Oculatella sp. LEGE 06141]MBE9182172.1 hypothetical protein [Oculatella sp. LEGE 06141]
MTFGSKKRFKLEEDGTIVARAGTQSNCGGIAAIRVRITPVTKAGIEFFSLEEECNGEGFGLMVPATAMPAVYKAAVFRGAQQAYDESDLSEGIEFVLIDALVHPVDANERKFMEAGSSAIIGWIKHRSDNQ